MSFNIEYSCQLPTWSVAVLQLMTNPVIDH